VATDKQYLGLIAAAYTPFHDDGSVDLGRIEPMVDYLAGQGVSGLYVCGSTGEGMSLSSEERRGVARRFVEVADGRLPVIIQVGHNSLAEARSLAEHAQSIGAEAISATCPSYYEIDGVQRLVESMAQVARGAPNLPFYYYHIPRFTGASIDMPDFLIRAGAAIPNLAGLKYSDFAVHGFQACLLAEGGRYDVLWGVDEMLLAALATGAKGFVGSTYNIAAPLYRKLIAAFERGDLELAQQLQATSVQLVRTLASYPFHAAMREVLAMRRVDCGRCRLPNGRLTREETANLRRRLEEIGCGEVCTAAPAG
jgi:N-acetylneuraminate lyase